MPLTFSHDGNLAGPALVPLADMKAHLHVTDSAHDADVTAISAAAQAGILEYLTTAADPAWTATTVPKTVAHAIKILATHLYVDRSADPAQGSPSASDQAWAAIREMLGRRRDPTLA